MIYAVQDYEIDTSVFEIRRDGRALNVEPRVFNLLRHLIENRDRLASKDELIDVIWNGRIVSDSALSSAIKAARQVMGDEGRAQRVIRTIHGRGFRFVADVEIRPVERANSVTLIQDNPIATPSAPAKPPPKIVVVPFSADTPFVEYPGLPSALAHDIIQSLARLRWLRVVPRASAFRLANVSDPVEAADTQLGADYALFGSMTSAGRGFELQFELVQVSERRVIWADRISEQLDMVHNTRDVIAGRVVASIENQIPEHEARLASLSAPENLDAWSAFHLGISRMHQFKGDETQHALALFDRATQLEPGFARAWAGRSAAHFQTAFNEYAGVEKAAAIARAQADAEAAMALDPSDPFCNFAYGRVSWLKGDAEAGLGALARATDINPSFAQGHYAYALSHLMAGLPFDAQGTADMAMKLSPLDPLFYGFLGVHTFSRLQEDDHAETARWANRAAISPNALPVMDLVAVVANDLAGEKVAARRWADRARRRSASISSRRFFDSLPFAEGVLRDRLEKGFALYRF